MSDGEILLVLLVVLGFIPFYLIAITLSFIGLLRKYLKRKVRFMELEIESLSAELDSYRYAEE